MSSIGLVYILLPGCGLPWEGLRVRAVFEAVHDPPAGPLSPPLRPRHCLQSDRSDNTCRATCVGINVRILPRG